MDILHRILLFLGITTAVISVCLCARGGSSYRGGSRSVRYSRYRTVTYYRSSSGGGGGVITGYVFAGLIGAGLLGVAIFFCVKYATKKKRAVTPRTGQTKPPVHTVSGHMVQPQPYRGPYPVLNNPAPPPPGLSPSFYPPPPPPSYSQISRGNGAPLPPVDEPPPSYSQTQPDPPPPGSAEGKLTS